MKLHTKAVRVAHRQYGLLTHAQAIALGYSPNQIRTYVHTGAWVQIRKSVYVVGAVPPSWEQTLCAVTLGFDDLPVGLANCAGIGDHIEISGFQVLEQNVAFKR